jgi:hypothetical protein
VLLVVLVLVPGQKLVQGLRRLVLLRLEDVVVRCCRLFLVGLVGVPIGRG